MSGHQFAMYNLGTSMLCHIKHVWLRQQEDQHQHQRRLSCGYKFSTEIWKNMENEQGTRTREKRKANNKSKQNMLI